MTLNDDLKLTAGAVGILKSQGIDRLRSSVRGMDISAFKEQVGQISDRDLFRLLWAVGLRADEQDVVQERIREIEKKSA